MHLLQIGVLMVKRDQIESKMKSYIDDNKLGAFEAFYMWSKGTGSETIAGALGNKYGTTEGFDTVMADINSLGIRGPSERVESTNEEVGVVIRDVFRKLQQPLLDNISKNLVALTESEKHLLLGVINSSLFDNERIKLDDLKLAYRALFGKTMKDRDFINSLLLLERIGVIYYDRAYGGRIEMIIVPEYIYTLQPQIEAKLPKVTIAEEGQES